MTRMTLKIAPLMLVVVATSGCQSPLLKGWGFMKAPSQPSGFTRQAADAELALEEGRAYLRSGQLAAAVASFRIARTDPETAAEASNGLGVAYAKIGRMDLADRYFRTAMALKPSEDRFAANLLRLQRDVMVARRPAPDAAAPSLAAAERVPEQMVQADMAVPKRVAAKVRQPEILIVTGKEQAPAPTMEVASRTPAAKPTETEAEAKPEPKVELLGRLSTKPLEVAF